MVVAILWFGRRSTRMRHPAKALAIAIVVAGVGEILQSTFDIRTIVLNALSKDATLTGRAEIWRAIADQRINSLVGYGYLAFWDSPITQAYRAAGGTAIVGSRYGYLEVFVDGGGIGELLLLLVLISVFRNIFREIPGGPHLS